MLAAILLRIPTLAYEPNAVPGMTNRWLGRWVTAAAVNFAQTTSFFRNAEVTGVPVRAEIFHLPPRPTNAPPRLLVTAGSNGALIFNDTMPKIAARLLEAVPGLSIVHQSGPRQLETTRAAYAASGADATRWSVEAFLTDMPAQYAAADLVLARSGSTVAELCAAAKPSLLVPFAAAADDHQRKNAEVLEQAGAAVMLLQRDVTPETLLHQLAAAPPQPRPPRSDGRTSPHPRPPRSPAAHRLDRAATRKHEIRSPFIPKKQKAGDRSPALHHPSHQLEALPASATTAAVEAAAPTAAMKAAARCAATKVSVTATTRSATAKVGMTATTRSAAAKVGTTTAIVTAKSSPRFSLSAARIRTHLRSRPPRITATCIRMVAAESTSLTAVITRTRGLVVEATRSHSLRHGSRSHCR